MSNKIVAIGVTKRKTGPLKIKFTENLQARLRRCRPLSDFEMINFIELPKPSTKLEALEFIENHANFQDEKVHFLVMQKLLRYRNKHRRDDRRKNLEQTTVQDVLDATM